jgi:EAL domain-containing protein (putative c-di-GMP-specific phosphodiesterase class I)
VAVNLSACQLADRELEATVSAALAESAVEPASLCVEVTESSLMQDERRCHSTLAALRALGVAVAVDDFGTGYSSLAQLKRLPVDILKVPREFVTRLGDDPRDCAILTAVTELARALDMRVVAEGVETVWQAIAVRALGVDLAQGFYFDRPASAVEIPGLLERSTVRTCSAGGRHGARRLPHASNRAL